MNPTTLAPSTEDTARRRSIAFLNWAHTVDHFVLLIYPTVVIGLVSVYGRPYSELIALSSAAFIAFGLFSLPAGWLADRWSRRNMMVAFYLGCGASLIGAALAPSLMALAIALFMLGIFAAIYHPVGTAMVIESATHRGRTMAFNGVCGNLGISLAAGITAALMAALSWRGAFFVPGIVCVATGIAYVWLIPNEAQHKSARSATADVPLSPAVKASLGWAVLRRRDRESLFETFTAERVEIRSNRAQPRQLDGDLIEPGRSLKISLRPAALLLCVPQPESHPDLAYDASAVASRADR